MDETVKWLRERASKYQRVDGSPGLLASNTWGWRTIAKILRDAADKLEMKGKK